MRRPAQYDPNQHPHFYCDDTPGDITGGGTLEQFKRRSWQPVPKLRSPVVRVSPQMARRLFACQYLAAKVKQLCPPGMSGLESHDQIMPLPAATYPDVIPGGNLIEGEEYLLGGLSSGVGQRSAGRTIRTHPSMLRSRGGAPYAAGGRPLNVFQRVLMAKKIAKAAECNQVIQAPEPAKDFAKLPFPQGSRPKWER